MKLSLSFVFSAFIGLAFGQSVKSEDITYTYVKLPTNPIQPKIENYYSNITSSAEATNAKLMAEYEAEKARAEADYQRELADYPAKVKAADDKYAKEMEVYNAKSTATKVIEKQILNENTKPVKDYVAQPYRRTVAQPVLKTSYDYPSLAATYLVLDGFTKAQVNALSYTVNIEGFEHSQPMIKTEVKDEVSVKDGVRSTYKVTYYWIEFTYRMPMSVRISGVNNQEIFYVAPAELSAFKTYKSSSSKTSPSADFNMLIKSTEEALLKENLKFINHLVNDRIGYEVTSRATSLDYVKSKNDAHNDVQEAFNNAMFGLKSLTSNEAMAKQKLTAAVDAFKVILTESDVMDKKARIDKDVTVAIYFDLLECYFALRNTADADAALKALGQLDLSNRDKKQKEKMEELFFDLNMRKAANGL
ncbi:MAG: hypothetical protein ACKOXP_04990 [Flavobacteriales bacterium]